MKAHDTETITYSFNNATKLPWKKMKFHTFLKEDSSFKFIEDPSQSEPMSSLPNPSPLLFSKFHNKVSTLSKHPQGSICKSKSVPDSLVQLLMSNNVNYEHFRKHKNQEDILDVLGYLTELISSYSDKHLSFFFSTVVVCLFREVGILSLTSLVNNLQTQYIQLSHTILCPIMCLKYNLWLSVWEDQGHASKKSKKSRTTYFYWYDSSKELVDCKEFQGDYIHLPFQSHILYI